MYNIWCPCPTIISPGLRFSGPITSYHLVPLIWSLADRTLAFFMLTPLTLETFSHSVPNVFHVPFASDVEIQCELATADIMSFVYWQHPPLLNCKLLFANSTPFLKISSDEIPISEGFHAVLIVTALLLTVFKLFVSFNVITVVLTKVITAIITNKTVAITLLILPVNFPLIFHLLCFCN